MFKVGDVITGTEKASCYVVTTPEAIMEVVSLNPHGYMNVKVLKHQTMRQEVGAVYHVLNDLDYFKLTMFKKTNTKGW